MAGPSAARTQARGKRRATVKQVGKALTATQAQTIQTGVLRAPAQDLERLLDAALSLWETPPADESGPEEQDAEEQDAEGESDASESSDVDDGDADAEGDNTESLENSTLDEGEPDRDETLPGSEDVIVEIAGAGGQRRLCLYSGLSDHLLRLRGGSRMTHAYHQALRLRITATLAVARAITSDNGAFFLDGGAVVPLRRDRVREALGLTEGQFSNLLAASCLRTPAGAQHRLDTFFVRYSGDESTETAMVEALVQRADQDRLQAQARAPGVKRQALTDEAWLEYVNHARQERGLPPVGKAALAAARADRLGLPGGIQRPKLYDQGLSVIGMVSGGQDADLLQKWKRLLVPLLAHKNARTRATAAAWLSEVETRLRGKE